MSKDVTFPANWFNQEKLAAITHAPVSGVVGSSERIILRDNLDGLDFSKPVSISAMLLKGWAHGAIHGWQQESFASNMGVVPLTDGHRNLLRLSCKALKVWEYVKSKLPQVQEEEDFAADIEDDLLLDKEEA